MTKFWLTQGPEFSKEAITNIFSLAILNKVYIPKL